MHLDAGVRIFIRDLHGRLFIGAKSLTRLARIVLHYLREPKLSGCLARSTMRAKARLDATARSRPPLPLPRG